MKSDDRLNFLRDVKATVRVTLSDSFRSLARLSIFTHLRNLYEKSLDDAVMVGTALLETAESVVITTLHAPASTTTARTRGRQNRGGRLAQGNHSHAHSVHVEGRAHGARAAASATAAEHVTEYQNRTITDGRQPSAASWRRLAERG